MAKNEVSIDKKVYLYLDTVTNSVISRGITFPEFIDGIGKKRLPSALLLLDKKYDTVNYNQHTNFGFIDDTEKMKQRAIVLEKQTQNFSWLDFEEIDMLNQLTGQEIAEILYLAHRGTHLRSPFYYKLQNEYAYLSLDEGERTKVYYRDITRFYDMIANVITDRISVLIHKKTLFGKLRKKSIVGLPVTLLRSLKLLLKEGCVLSFDQLERTKTEIRLPIANSDEENDENITLDDNENEIVPKAWIVYSIKNNEWTFEY
ncbi:hypothetical protein [Brochothrix thermosphacta]|uniref:hypothetical protein n=1 Tax=Brochothrix thermosphacta TaxID=2756 RepID=UPI00083FD947|nr:hypothetical protein [Brochothrix thermosphacta]ODJ58227.1 hypothetical protein BFR44_08650 [Brochothrix thermosphacta]